MNSQFDRQIHQMMQRVVDESPPAPELREPSPMLTQSRRRVPGWAAALAAAAALFMIVGGTALLFSNGTSDVGQDAIPTTIVMGDEAVTGVAAGRTVEVVVSGVSGHDGGELAGVVYAGDDLPDLHRDALGGFWAVVDGDPFAVTEVVRAPGDDVDLVGRFPYVSGEAMVVEPGIYTLVLWTDLGLSPVSRWVPVNSDGQGLLGCHVTFEVGDESQTAVAVSPTLHPDGWNVDCETGRVIPGTDASAAVAPPDSGWPMGWEEVPLEMPTVTGVAAGRTVEVVVSGVSGHDGGELAGVVYAGDDLPDLHRDALGGFWAVVDGDPFAVTEVVRAPGDDVDLVGQVPLCVWEAMVVEPGIYTLVLWTDLGLSPVSRWVPVNSDGQGLLGCHVTFEVGDESQTAVAVSPTLHPDGWNVDCETGRVIPGTDASAAVAPPDR